MKKNNCNNGLSTDTHDQAICFKDMKSDITNENLYAVIVKYDDDVSDRMLDFGSVYLKDPKTGHGFIADSDNYQCYGRKVKVSLCDIDDTYRERYGEENYELMTSDFFSDDITLEVYTGDDPDIPTPVSIELIVIADGKEKSLKGTSW